MAPKESISDKRQRIMQAALVLFAQRGFHGSPTSAIAQEAEVGVGTIYRYFKDKNTLIEELFQDLQQRYHQQLLVNYDPAAPLPNRFQQLFAELLRMFISRPAEFRFMELYYYSPYATAASSRLPNDEGVIYTILREAKDQGCCKDVPMKVLEAMAWGPLVALAKENSIRRLPVSDQIINQTALAAWDALRRH
ncbi:TetR/AcrR family transcriptional regulator [Desulfurivibrio alkaliphilus]|uniref:Transcriptional regulator, TetR family n=1 Tax=Desulfurivibrio alkaliphilus (strain DSM 19089 / UNIQEM U267 / AHT2) TaxID=589865 RepID=D6Z179_DESAT|nr:TetR/AcrR family transcriptional regulator [Desulfurivibrio alkaliphilus]ADH85334.1 transcriptional regulator, TetR family [Desulfurivibrio alkaliphilus AHT 2]